MAKLDTGSATPLYIQLAEEIRRGVSTGAMEPGAQIMPEAAMCEAYGVSRITVRKAVNLLVEDKVLFRKQGKGTFVAYPDFFENANIRHNSFTAATIETASTPYTTVLSQGLTAIDSHIANQYPMPASCEKEMVCIMRLRYLDKKPVVYEVDYLPTRYSSLLECRLDNQSLYALLHEHFSVVPTHFCDRFDVTLASSTLAKRLQVESGHPLLVINQTVFDAERNVIYYNTQFVRTDAYEYCIRSFNNT